MLENNAGKIVVNGVGENSSTIVISIEQIVGKSSQKALSVNTHGLTQVEIGQLQTSSTKLNIQDGVMTISGIDARADIKNIYFYREESLGVYSMKEEDIYVWNAVDEFTLYDTLPSGYYLVVIEYKSDVATDLVDASLNYMDNTAIRRVRVLDTPTLYIVDGVLTWNSVKDAQEDIVYELTMVTPSGDTICERLTNELTYDTTALDFAVGEYNITIRAISDNCIKSKSSENFTATKLASPSVTLVRDSRVLKLQWNGIDNATSYTVYDYYAKNDTYTVTTVDISSFDSVIWQNSGIKKYELEINNDVELGNHQYYIIAHGTSTTISNVSGNYQYANIGYLDSSNSSSNTNTDYIVSSQAITNTVVKVYVSDGVLSWTSVENVDYYNVHIKAYFELDATGKGINPESYLISVAEPKLDTSTITYKNFNTALFLDITIENVVTNTNFFVVSTRADRPQKNIVVFNKQQLVENRDYEVDNGMLKYTIKAEDIESLVELVSKNKLSTSMNLTIDMKNIFVDGNSNDQRILRSFIEPIISINNVEYEIGRDSSDKYVNIPDYYIYMYDATGNTLIDSTTYLELMSKENKVIDDNVKLIEFYIPLPSTLEYGTYNITFRAKGNTTGNAGDIATANSIVSSNMEGFKLDSPKNVFQTLDQNSTYEIRNGVLKFTPTPTKSSNNMAYVAEYLIQFSAVNGSGETDTQVVSVAITNDKSKLYTNGYAGYIDLVQKIVEVDIYKLFVLTEYDNLPQEEATKLEDIKSALYSDFRYLEVEINYHIRVQAMGGLVVIDETQDLEYTNYFNSNLSRLEKTFKVLSAPVIYVNNDSVNWNISKDVVNYTIYFYNYETSDLVYTTTILEKDFPTNDTVFRFTDIQDNPNIPAGIYNIKVVANGNGDEKLTSRLTDCSDFITEKMEAVTVKVVDGVYQWNNTSYRVTGNTIDHINNEPNIYLYYVVEIYHNGQYDSSVDRVEVVAKPGEDITIWELPEGYASESNGSKVEYSIRVYANTFMAGNNCLIPTDSNIGYFEQKARIRSNPIDKTFTITTDGYIKFEDSNTDNNYIIFIYNDGTDVLDFVTKPLSLDSAKSFSIYELEDVDGKIFDADAGTYYIQVKSIDKVNYTDTYSEEKNNEDAILRSVFTDRFTIQLIAKPNFEITEGEIDWDTNFSSLQTEYAGSRIIIEGKFQVGEDDKYTTSPLWLEFDATTISFTFQDIKVKPIYTTGNDNYINHYLYRQDIQGQNGLTTLRFVEGQKYMISIRFVGVENEEVEYNNEESYLISSQSYDRVTYLNTNPKAPSNPKQLKNSNADIYNNIPLDTNYKNFIYWNLSTYENNSNTHNVEDYDVMVYLRNFEVDAMGNKEYVDYELAYEYILRDVTSAHYSVQLKDYLRGQSLGVTSQDYFRLYEYAGNNCGVYLSLDEVLNRVSKEGYDFAEWDICIYVEAVGSTVDYTVNEESEIYLITHHYDIEDILAITENNSYVLTISLPAVPDNLDYDGYGTITWDPINDSNIYNELVVAYEKTTTTVADLNTDYYTNMSRLVLEISGDGAITINGNKATKEDLDAIKLLLGMSDLLDEDFISDSVYALFGSYGKTFYIDTITLAPNVSSYKLKYLTSNIRVIALRSISIMKDETSDGSEFLDTFVSNPAVLSVFSFGSGFEFTLFRSGDGSDDNPFVVSNIIDIASYIEEYCYFEQDVSKGNEFTLNKDQNGEYLSTILVKTQKIFNGVFDGKGAKYVVTYADVTVGKDSSNTFVASLFYAIGESAMVMNMNIVANNSYNDSTDPVINQTSGNVNFAGVAYYNYGIIANVDVSGTVCARNTNNNASVVCTVYMSGITTYNYGSIYYCDVSATFDTDTTYNVNIAGIAFNNGNNDKIYNYNQPSDNDYVGNIHNIEVCSFSGSMTGHNMAGIVYNMYSGSIKYCNNTGTMIYNNNVGGDGSHYMAGIVGYLANSVDTASKTSNNVTLSNTYVELTKLTIELSNKYNVYFGGLVCRNSSATNNGNKVVMINTCYANIDKESNTTTINSGSTGGGIIWVMISLSKNGDACEYSNVYYKNSDRKPFNTDDTSDVSYFVGNYYDGYSSSNYYIVTNGVNADLITLITGYTFDNNTKLLQKNDVVA